MATGRIGTADLPGATNTTIYTCPASTYAVASVNFVNRGNSPVLVRLAICDTSTPGNDEYIEYDVELNPKNVLERTGIVIDASKLIVAYASSSNVSVVAMGIETAA